MVYQTQDKIEVYFDMIGTKNSQGMIKTYSNMMLPQEAKKGPFQGQQGEGVALPFWRLQGTISTTEIPQDFSGEKAQTPKSQNLHKIAQKGALQGLGGVKQTQTTKHS